MTDPEKPSEEEMHNARHKELLEHLRGVHESVDNMREQNSAEHGSLFSKLLHVTEVLHWVRAKWERFTRHPDGPPDKPPFT